MAAHFPLAPLFHQSFPATLGVWSKSNFLSLIELPAQSRGRKVICGMSVQ